MDTLTSNLLRIISDHVRGLTTQDEFIEHLVNVACASHSANVGKA